MMKPMPRKGTETAIIGEKTSHYLMKPMPRKGTETNVAFLKVSGNYMMKPMPRKGTETASNVTLGTHH